MAVQPDELVEARRQLAHGVEVAGRVERRASGVVAAPEFTLTIDLHAGSARALRMGSDLTVDYVRFSSDYRT